MTKTAPTTKPTRHHQTKRASFLTPSNSPDSSVSIGCGQRSPTSSTISLGSNLACVGNHRGAMAGPFGMAAGAEPSVRAILLQHMG
ncbi:hypothetical protein [Pseudoduganella sp. HUAS MS19]